MSDIPKGTDTLAESSEAKPPERLSPKGIAAMQGQGVTLEALQERVQELEAEVKAREAAELAQLQNRPQETPLSAPPQSDKPEPPPTPGGSKEKEREPVIERQFSSPEGA